MTTDSGFVLVSRNLFNHMRRHCEQCLGFDGRLEDSPDGGVVLMPLGRRDADSLKRKPSTGPPRDKRHCKERLPPADAALSWFVQHVPKALDWRARQVELGLNTAVQYERVIRAFGNLADVRIEAPCEGANSHDALVNLAEKMALLTKKSLANAKLQRSFAYFQALILLSYCHVLQKRDVPFTEIDRIVGHITANERDRRKMLKGAVWVNKIIKTLSGNGWTIYRATELFFIAALSPSYLGSIHHKNGFQSLVDRLKSDDFVGHNYGDCLRPTYTIPGLIKSLISRFTVATIEISIEEICKALVYPVNQVSESVRDVCAVRSASADTSVTAHNLRFEVLDPSSFETSEPCSNQSQSLTPTQSLSSPVVSTLVPAHTNHTIVTLLSASKFDGLVDGDDLLALATPAKTQIHAEIVYEISVKFRSRGFICESGDLITEFLKSQIFDSDEEHRRILGLLSLSQAYNRIYQFDFVRAREESCKWTPSNVNLSDRELGLLCDQLRTTGRILRGEGRFDEARSCFEGCLATHGLSKSQRTLIVCHLSDVYCELAYVQRIADPTSEPELRYLDWGREMIEHEIDRERVSNRHSRSFRRLLLSLAEVEIRQNRFDEATGLLSELLNIYGTLVQSDVDDRVGHVRALIARARISKLHEAEDSWTAALLQNKAYNPEEEDVFTCGIIYMFISLTRFQQGNDKGSQDMFQNAVQVIRRKKRQFLMPGLGTYLFDYVRLELALKARFVLSEIAC